MSKFLIVLEKDMSITYTEDKEISLIDFIVLVASKPWLHVSKQGIAIQVSHIKYIEKLS